MEPRRIIPCLDVHGGRVTRGERFGLAERGELRDVGDPVELARRYCADGADELVLYDITATAEERRAAMDVMARVVEVSTVPLTVGGGVRSVEDCERLFGLGVAKVSLNSGAVRDPELVRRAAERFGRERVVLALDVKRRADGTGWDLYTAGGRRKEEQEPVAWAVRGQELGAGEVVLNSIDADGMRSGYDLDLTRTVADAVDLPVIASGGAGSARHMLEVLTRTRAAAALAAGIFHSGEVSVSEVKRLLAEAGVPVRAA